MTIIPKPGHSYQLIPLGLATIHDPIIATIDRIYWTGSVSYDYTTSTGVDNRVECRLSDFVLMIDKEVDAPEESGE